MLTVVRAKRRDDRNDQKTTRVAELEECRDDLKSPCTSGDDIHVCNFRFYIPGGIKGAISSLSMLEQLGMGYKLAHISWFPNGVNRGCSCLEPEIRKIYKQEENCSAP